MSGVSPHAFLLRLLCLALSKRSLYKAWTSILSCISFFLSSCHMQLFRYLKKCTKSQKHCSFHQKLFIWKNIWMQFFQFAPYLATFLWHQTRAKTRGVCPMLSLANTSAPARTRISVHSRSPSDAARCSGDIPELVLLVTTVTTMIYKTACLALLSLLPLSLYLRNGNFAVCVRGNNSNQTPTRWCQHPAPVGKWGIRRFWVNSGRTGPCE